MHRKFIIYFIYYKNILHAAGIRADPTCLRCRCQNLEVWAFGRILKKCKKNTLEVAYCSQNVLVRIMRTDRGPYAGCSTAIFKWCAIVIGEMKYLFQ